MSDKPLAYHITFGIFGTRLHGDPRGTIDRLHNKPGDPIIGQNADWHALESGSLAGEPVILNDDACLWIERANVAACERGGWTYHAAACQSNHVHVLLTSFDDSKLTCRLLKRWLSERLNCKYESALPASGRWWAKGGSIKWVWDECYFENVKRYIERQRASES